MSLEETYKLVSEGGKCPFCNGSVESGYIYSDHFISWIKDEPSGRFPKGEELVRDYQKSWQLMKAGKCSDCKFLVVYFGELPPTG